MCRQQCHLIFSHEKTLIKVTFYSPDGNMIQGLLTSLLLYYLKKKKKQQKNNNNNNNDNNEPRHEKTNILHI